MRGHEARRRAPTIMPFSLLLRPSGASSTSHSRAAIVLGVERRARVGRPRSAERPHQRDVDVRRHEPSRFAVPSTRRPAILLATARRVPARFRSPPVKSSAAAHSAVRHFCGRKCHHAPRWSRCRRSQNCCRARGHESNHFEYDAQSFTRRRAGRRLFGCLRLLRLHVGAHV